MANYSLLLFRASIVLALLFISEADLISDVCSKAQKTFLCNQALRSDPCSRGANLPGLGKIAIDESRAAVQNTIKVAKLFDNRGNKGKSETCIETCGDAIDNLNDCQKLVKARDKFSLNTLQTKASAALTDVSTCDDEFGAGEPAKLKEASQTAQDLIDVVLVIANLLAGN
ncbi:hypothetical protein BUALT_Bualt01G0139900 [Buddleja alternifolia]|uniref:Pectinesterase inhibitor domain-containing protein n=1 Tax=Buddleja alternifolia TaxID=168488 RepID=A0AAV6YFI6_9LAMI|nr:hypothetical protein BUALT_Bualt01G0139900 [Buddleja alternifolia]